jgi:protein TonB
MLLIVGAHVAVVAIAMSVKMALPDAPTRTTTKVIHIPIKEPPPPETQQTKQQQPTHSVIDRVKPQVPTPLPTPIDIKSGPVEIPFSGPIAGPARNPEPLVFPEPVIEPVRTGPRLATSGEALRPPYPQSKLDSQQEAALRLKLSIDDRGRVVWVEAVGPADPAFLNAARKHLIARWRYQPASEGGRAVASSTVFTLRFELEG